MSFAIHRKAAKTGSSCQRRELLFGLAGEVDARPIAKAIRASGLSRCCLWGSPLAVAGFGRVPAAVPVPVNSAASRQQIESLYCPGSGVLPPVLAGREAESAVLDAFRGKLLSGAPIPKDEIIYR